MDTDFSFARHAGRCVEFCDMNTNNRATSITGWSRVKSRRGLNSTTAPTHACDSVAHFVSRTTRSPTVCANLRPVCMFSGADTLTGLTDEEVRLCERRCDLLLDELQLDLDNDDLNFQLESTYASTTYWLAASYSAMAS